ncbi:MAG: hypothetical protein V7676_18485 [Parasphingorhabdus sp.]|uniref:hypothetical protein n=1 Tax=Parasphingorhabdus sp. TaxID=2709688 RepID=UPI003003036B
MVSSQLDSDDKPTTRDIYVQHYEQFRSMNVILYQLPVIFSTILGALYYFAFSFVKVSETISIFVLAFCGIVSIVGVIVIQRFGLAFSAYIDNLNELDGRFKITLRDSKCPSVLTAIKMLLWATLIMSIVAIWYISSDMLVLAASSAAD